MYESVVSDKLCTLSTLSRSWATKDEEDRGFFIVKLITVKSLNKVLQDKVSFVKFVIGDAILEDVFLCHDLIKL